MRGFCLGSTDKANFTSEKMFLILQLNKMNFILTHYIPVQDHSKHSWQKLLLTASCNAKKKKIAEVYVLPLQR